MRLIARDYVSGAEQAERATRKLHTQISALEKASAGSGKGLDAGSKKVQQSARRYADAAGLYEQSSKRFGQASTVFEDSAGRYGEAADWYGTSARTVTGAARSHDAASKRYETASGRYRSAADTLAGAASVNHSASGSFRGAADGIDNSARQVSRAASSYEQSAQRISRSNSNMTKIALVGTAALAGTGGALHLLAPAALAAGAAVSLLPGLVGGAVGSLGALKIATIGVGDAVGELYAEDDPFARLSPSAIALVNTLGALKPQILGFQQSVQNEALRGLDGNLLRLADTTLPAVSGSIHKLAADWSLMATAATDAFTDPVVMSAINTTFGSADRWLDQIAVRLQPLGRMFAQLAVSADPLVRAFGDSMVSGIDRMTAAVDRAKRSGRLDEFFATASETAGHLMSIMGDIAGIIGTVVSALNRQNSTIGETAASLDAYLRSGRAAADMAGIVDTLSAAYEGVADVLRPLAAVARDALADPATRDAVESFFDVLAVGSEVIRTISDLFHALPGPVQSVVITVVALGLVAKKASAAIAIMGAAAGSASAKLTAMGGAGAKAGSALSRITAGAGKAVTALIALEIAAAILGQFGPAAANVDKLTDSLTKFGAAGQVSGELARVFGDDLSGLSDIAGAAGDGWFNNLGRSIESAIPGAKELNEVLNGGSWTGATERMEALDAAVAKYASTTNDHKGTIQIWNELLSKSGMNADELLQLMPQTSAELTRLGDAAHTGAGSVSALEERTKLLAGGMTNAVREGRSLISIFEELNGAAINFAEAEIQAEEQIDALSASLKENGLALNKQGSDFAISTEKGRENKQAMLDLIGTAAEAAQAKYEESGSVEQASAVYDRYIGQLRSTLRQAGMTEAQIDALIGTYARMPALKETEIRAKGVHESQAAVDVLKRKIDALKSKNIYVNGTVRWTAEGDLQVPGGKILERRHGGVAIPMAEGGLRDAAIYPASNPPLYQFAEPETGGELFLPRRGDESRGRQLLAVAASWYGGRFIAAANGYASTSATPAASGLVSVGPRRDTGGSRLESVESYVQARDAIARLNKELKENGRSFDKSTQKGRDNTSALTSAIRAAQSAAEAKFEETGSVKAANKEYDNHIAKLRKTLAQQKVSSAQIKKLMKSLATRPTYDVAASTSAGAIASAQASMSAESSLAAFGDTLSLNKAVFDTKDETGRENFNALFRLLGDAEDAAQAVLTQTGSAKKATAVYDGYVAQLRQILAGSGMAKAAIDSLIKTYGKIALTPNERGGVYMPQVMSLSGAAQFPASGSSLYGFAEPKTGGELFLPRLGDRQRGRDLLSIGAGWYGGQVTFNDGGGKNVQGAPSTTLTVNAGQTRLTLSGLQGMLRQLDARARVGRPR
ncbi:hypothetical protein [Melissospora conviva]|uniref:hypothetical protein n=1 Tax=Melissospora conviva TaxID=3388432 RepID=UPI003C290E19